MGDDMHTTYTTHSMAITRCRKLNLNSISMAYNTFHPANIMSRRRN
jgi:hypothetical protein